MSDNLRLTDGRDDSKISLTQHHEIEYWTKALRVSEPVLRKAVAAVGNVVKHVKKWLDQNGH